MSVKNDVDLLRQVPLFYDVNPAHLQVLLFSAKQVDTEPGKLLLRKGKEGSAAFLVLHGKGDVYEGSGKKTRLIARVERGAFIGELSMVAHLPYTASIRATSPLITMRITNELFMRVCAEFPDVGSKVLVKLSEQLDESMDNLRDVQNYFQQAKSFTRL